MISPPLALGTAGLELGFRLYAKTGSSWESLAVDDLAAVELGDGDYYVVGLPEESRRCVLMVYELGSPAAVLSSYSFGPPPAVVWRNEIALDSLTLRVKRHDTFGALALAVLSGLPEEIGEAEVTFTLFDPVAGAAVEGVVARPAVIAEVVVDAATGTFGATLLYQKEAPAVAAAGRFLGEFQIVFPGGSKLTVPSDDSMVIAVVPDFDGA